LNPLRFATLPFLVAASINAVGAPSAECTLPVPDGADRKPTTPNVHGVIAKFKGQEVVLRQAKTGRLVVIRLPEKPEIYTVFGGDAGLNELQAGQTAWVWFVGCKWPPTGKPTSAYFQIYSTDPSDKPK
jgi:hypothetical protein